MFHKTTFLRQMLPFVLCLCVHVSIGQTKNPDSLIAALKTRNLTQEERSKHLSLLAHYHPRNDTALLVAQQALDLAVDIGNPILEAEALEEISHLQNKLGNNDLSFQASFRALRIYESLKMPVRQAASYTQLANNYMSNENFEEAIESLKKAESIYATSNEGENLVFTMLNLGEMFRLAGQLDSAETRFKEVISRNLQLKSPIAQGYSQGNLGMVHAEQGRLAEAKQNLTAAIVLMEPLDDPYSTSVYVAELGGVLKKEGDVQGAEQMLLKAMEMAQKAGLKEQIRDFGAKLSQFYESEGALDKALDYQKLFQVYQDSLVNKENIQKIERLKASYEIDKRESEIGLLNTINT
ncbi:MAG: tetratricopeptide repeat protein, partial [Allomuricauda sp.]